MRTLTLWSRKAAALVVAAVLASGAGVSPSARAAGVTTPTQDDQVILQLQIKKFRMGNELRGYHTANGTCVDLADMILALDLPVRLDKKSRRATGWLFREDQTFTLDRDKNTVQIVNKERALQPGELYDTPEGWCVDTKSLAGWLGVRLTPNLYDAALTLDSDAPLPFIEAIERKSRAARLRDKKSFNLADYPQTKLPYQTWRTPSVDVVADVSWIRSDNGSGQLRRRYQAYASGEVAGVSVDARLASDSTGTPDTLRMSAYRKDPAGGMLGPLKATQVAAGDVEVFSGNLAGAGGVGRGAFVSNRPLERPTSFGKTVLRGALPIGWDAELYRNGQLLAFQSDRADGRYEFDVDLVYGSNDLEVVLYGPQGQVRRESQSVPIGYAAVAPGRLEYWAGVIQRNRDLISFHDPPNPLDTGWQYGFGAQYGLDNRTVLGMSGHSLFLQGKRRDFAEFDMQRALGPMLLDLTGAQEFGAGRAYRASAIGRVGKINVTGEALFLDGSFTSGLVGQQERSHQTILLEAILGSGRRVVPVGAGYTRSVLADGRKVNEWLARASLVLPRLSLTGVITDREVSGGRADTEGLSVGMLANTRVLGFLVRADATYRVTGLRKGFDNARLTIEKPLDDRSDLRFDVQRDGRQRVTSFEAGYVRQFRQLALRVGATADSRGSIGANMGVSFSFGPNPFGKGMRFSNAKLAQRGEAAVSVFLDENGDGVRSPGEAPLEGVGLTAGQFGASEPTDKRGHAVIEGLNPYQKVLIGIDESTLPDPFLVPTKKGVVITPRAGVAAKLEIGVAPTGEVEGEIHGLEDTPRSGIKLELIDQAGEVVATTLSEFDGYFMFERVPYGTYRVQISAGAAQALGAARELGKTAVLTKDKSEVQLGVLRLRASQIAAAGAGTPGGSSP
uniref:carboxypeptidase regulatory-like domain-containing protein n=1 Tax=Altererythrobacter segetis TaxID=1104773 RepID=UPI001408CB1C|nr:carboxypeptidase regulatory-like domain-containing protein [Altererythrobacter segetis]